MTTKEIQQQIDRTSAIGGGTVVLPAGEHLCGTLVLKSGVRLLLSEGCVLRASDKEEAYPVLGKTVNETGVMRAMIFAENATGIAISGPGRIEGLGDAALSWNQSESVSFRPETLLFRDCREVRLSDFTIRNSSFWTVHLLRCEEVNIDRIILRNRRDRINTDGIDPDGCKRVRIRDCDIDCGDDGIVLKSTEGDDCEDITIENCRIRTPCAGLKIGTETLGDIRNIAIRGCQLHDCEMGFGIFLKDGGTVEDIRLEDLDIEGPGEFMIFLDHSPRYYDESPLGILRNIRLNDLRVRSPGRLFVSGPLSGLRLERIDWTLTGPMEFGKRGKPVGSVRHRIDPNRAFPERESAQITLYQAQNTLIRDLHLRATDPQDALNRRLLHTEQSSETMTGIQAECFLDPFVSAGV